MEHMEHLVRLVTDHPSIGTDALNTAIFVSTWRIDLTWYVKKYWKTFSLFSDSGTVNKIEKPVRKMDNFEFDAGIYGSMHA